MYFWLFILDAVGHRPTLIWIRTDLLTFSLSSKTMGERVEPEALKLEI